MRNRAAGLLDREALQNPHTSLTEEALQKNPEQERSFRYWSIGKKIRVSLLVCWWTRRQRVETNTG
jgi:hypothetical protein